MSGTEDMLGFWCEWDSANFDTLPIHVIETMSEMDWDIFNLLKLYESSGIVSVTFIDSHGMETEHILITKDEAAEHNERCIDRSKDF